VLGTPKLAPLEIVYSSEKMPAANLLFGHAAQEVSLTLKETKTLGRVMTNRAIIVYGD